MNRTLEDFIESTMRSNSVEDVSVAFHEAVASWGFNASAFGRYRSGSVTEFYWDRLPNDFAKIYCEQRWDRADPLFMRATQTARAFSWRTQDGDQRLSGAQQDFFAELRSRGVRHGVMTPFHGPLGQLDLCGCVTEEGEPVDMRVVDLVQGLALQAWLRCADLAPPSPSANPAPRLSARESECLSWLREAKSNWEISQILQISEKTVEFHVGNLMKKLNAENRLAAVLIGIKSGLVNL